jgi:hypothetical protein
MGEKPINGSEVLKVDIHSYQIHNVLNVYRQQLSQAKKAAPTSQQSKFKAQLDLVTLSGGDSRESVFERVSSTILDRIRNYGEYVPGPEAPPPEGIPRQHPQVSAPDKGRQFFFNTLDQNNRKVTNTMPVNDSSALMKHLAELAKKEGAAD